MKFKPAKIPEGINYSQSNPIKEFLLLGSGVLAVILLGVFLLGSLLDWSSKFIPFSYESAIAEPFIQEYVDEYGEGSAEVSQYLQGLADEIAPLMSLNEETQLTLHYVDNETINGMATLGGHIFIFRGLLEKLPSENALVALLAHEIAHVKLRHPVKALSKGVSIALLMAVVSGQSNTDVTGLLSNTSQLAFLGFSRSQEQAADYEVIAVSQHYYQHLQGAHELFAILLAESEQAAVDTIGWFRSHPEVSARINNVTELANNNRWQQHGQSTPIPNHIIKQLAQDKAAFELKNN